MDASPQQAAINAVMDQWFAFNRMTKDAVITAMNQAFDLWEGECRRLLGAMPIAGTGPSTPNVVEAWVDTWRKWTESWPRPLDVTARKR